MKSQKMHKSHKLKDSTRYISLSTIAVIISIAIVAINHLLYASDVLISPVVATIIFALFQFDKYTDKRFATVYFIGSLLFLLAFLILKPRYTVSQAENILESSINQDVNLSARELGYMMRKNSLHRGYYTFRNTDNELIAMDNETGDYNIIGEVNYIRWIANNIFLRNKLLNW